MFSALIFAVLCALYSQCISASPVYTSEDVFVPANCNKIASPGDHMLLEYSVVYANGTNGAYVRRPNQLYHVLLESSVSISEFLELPDDVLGFTSNSCWTEGNV